MSSALHTDFLVVHWVGGLEASEEVGGAEEEALC